ncbi:mitochondrial required protein 1 [Scheffersomyces coipomensis]|uniref:mitochondrial required protein 1 n=1 Tax=Scheffersomyces coipomensis TaxID=1788519 RepID=UPI00315DD7A5
MGVYIPPPNESDDSKDSKNKNKNNTKNNNDNNNITKPTSSSSSPPGSTTIVIPNPAGLIPHNPSIGLFWGPLTPAADNLPAFYGAIGLQFLLGLGCLRYTRQILFRPSQRILSSPSSSNSRFVRGSILKALAPALGGIITIFGSGLELARLTLPYDPWYEEAKYYRRLATKNGDVPSSWFGAYKYYKPMDLNTWIDRTGSWIKNIDGQLDDDDKESNDIFHNGGGMSPANESQRKAQSASSRLIAKLNKDDRYLEIYQKLINTNNKRFVSLLDHELKSINELNKAERLDLILEGKSPLVNPNYTKAHIQLGKFSIESDDDFDRAWINFEPWDELKLETEYEIRLIPHWDKYNGSSTVVESQTLNDNDDNVGNDNQSNTEVDNSILT